MGARFRSFGRWLVAGAAAASVVAAVPSSVGAHGRPVASERVGTSAPGRSFEHAATFDVRENGTEVAEIVAADHFGRQLLYTDSATGKVGFVDITDPADPLPSGTLEVGGEPTSVATSRLHGLVAVDTSTSFTTPSGQLKVVRLWDRSVVRTIELGGQPDSVTVSPDGRYAAVVVENERDEDLDDGLIPQDPPGELVVLDMRWWFLPGWWGVREVDLTGLAATAPEDPEAEFVDINRRNKAVVSLQENNHLAVVDLRTATVEQHFSAGEVTLEGVDATEEKIGPQKKGDLQLTETITRRREPDAVQWIDDWRFATANEGDYEDADGDEGGARGFTVFHVSGTVEHESGPALEWEMAAAGHYDEARSANKGVEPEGLESGRFAGRQLLFVGAERANAVGVYEMDGQGVPHLRQLLPTGSGPEGLLAVPDRRLFVVAAENAEDGVFPSMLTIYRERPGAPSYPGIRSAVATGAPVPWVALSGLAADPADADHLVAVSDAALGVSYLYDIDVASSPATIDARTPITGASATLDAEGVAFAPEGGYWIGSEGRVGARANLLVRVDGSGVVQQEIPLPAALVAGAGNYGIEGVAALGQAGATETLYVVLQREWADDPAGTVKIGRYDVSTDSWTFVDYLLDAPVAAGSWVGLSELTPLPDGTFAVIERDNVAGPDAAVKRVYGVDLAAAPFGPLGSPRSSVVKTLRRDALGDLTAGSVWTPDKLEGMAVAADGEVFVVTDNDGLDAAVGHTLFRPLGPWTAALAG